MPVIKCDSVFKIFGVNAKKLFESSNGNVDAKAFQDAGCVVGVNNASFEVNKGDLLVVMGLSGSGKSTLLRCISRLTEATAGKIYIDDEDLLALSEKKLIELRRNKMGMVFQSFALLPHKTVLENIAFPLQVKGVSTQDSIKRAMEMVDLVGLKGRENYFPRQLSGGQQQRVGIARSLAVEPDIWFLDEPFSALDPLIRKEMQDEFLRLQGVLNKTILFITHDFDEALRLADRIAIMDHGRLKQIGTPEAVYNQPENLFVAGFMGNPSMNLLPCWFDSAEQQLRLEHTEVAIKLESQHIDLIRPAISDQLVFGIRPERAHLSTTPTASNLQAKVHLVEPLGSANIIDILLSSDWDNTLLIKKT